MEAEEAEEEEDNEKDSSEMTSPCLSPLIKEVDVVVDPNNDDSFVDEFERASDIDDRNDFLPSTRCFFLRGVLDKGGVAFSSAPTPRTLINSRNDPVKHFILSV